MWGDVYEIHLGGHKMTLFDHLKWREDFSKASSEKPGFKELRAEIFQGTINFVKSNSYVLNGKQVEIDNKIINSEFF